MPADNRIEAALPADVIVHNGRIATQDDRRSFAQAAAVKDGKFVAVGSDPDVLKFRGEHTQVIDLGGRTVIPGLNDSHLHLIRGGLNYNLELRWDGVPSLADALRMLREQARRTPPPQWVRVVGGWTEFQFAERRMPTLEEINAVSPRHAGLRPAPLRPGHPERGGAAGLRLHEGHARPARRRNPAGQAGQPHRPAHRPAQRHDPLRHAGEGAEAAPGPAGQLHPALHAGDEPPGPHQLPSTPGAASRTTPTTTRSSRTCTGGAR